MPRLGQSPERTLWLAAACETTTLSLGGRLRSLLLECLPLGSEREPQLCWEHDTVGSQEILDLREGCQLNRSCAEQGLGGRAHAHCLVAIEHALPVGLRKRIYGLGESIARAHISLLLGLVHGVAAVILHDRNERMHLVGEGPAVLPNPHEMPGCLRLRQGDQLGRLDPVVMVNEVLVCHWLQGHGALVHLLACDLRGVREQVHGPLLEPLALPLEDTTVGLAELEGRGALHQLGQLAKLDSAGGQLVAELLVALDAEVAGDPLVGAHGEQRELAHHLDTDVADNPHQDGGTGEQPLVERHVGLQELQVLHAHVDGGRAPDEVASDHLDLGPKAKLLTRSSMCMVVHARPYGVPKSES